MKANQQGIKMKPRTKFVIGGIVILVVIIALSLQELQKMTVFFYTPEEVLANPSKFENKTIRIGALVQRGSVEWDAQDIRLSFNITEDGKKIFQCFMTESNLICSAKDREWLLKAK